MSDDDEVTSDVPPRYLCFFDPHLITDLLCWTQFMDWSNNAGEVDFSEHLRTFPVGYDENVHALWFLCESKHYHLGKKT